MRVRVRAHLRVICMTRHSCCPMSVGLSGLLCVSRCVRSLLDLEQLQRASLLSGLHGLTALMKMGHISQSKGCPQRVFLFQAHAARWML